MTLIEAVNIYVERKKAEGLSYSRSEKNRERCVTPILSE